PWLGIRMGAGHLEDRSAGDQASSQQSWLLEWQSLAVRAQLVPLLKGQLIVDRIRLEGPRLHLRRNAEGHGNWEGLGPTAPAESTKAGSRSQPAQTAGLEIRGGEIDYVDAASTTHLVVKKWQLDTGPWQSDGAHPFSFRTEFLVGGGPLPAEPIPAE